jgi:phosphoribosylformylglycinamidine (FGAM) synthase-like enzyme
LIEAAHDVSDGGLLTALAEMAFPTLSSRPVGARLVSPATFAPGIAQPAAYFGELGGFVVEVSRPVAFLELADRVGAIALERIGETTDTPAIVTAENGGTAHDLFALHEAWSAPLRDFYADALAETSG